MMQATEIQAYARQLFEAQGDKAIAEAARQAVARERQRDTEGAEMWRRIEAALMLMRGPRGSTYTNARPSARAPASASPPSTSGTPRTTRA